MKHFCAFVACLVVLAGCQFGEAVSLFDEDQAIERAVMTLRQHIGDKSLVLNVTIAPDALTIRAQNPSDRSRVDEWRLAQARVSGPDAYKLNLINPDIEANLFSLDEIDFTVAANLVRAAVERAALADKSKVVRMEIARQVFPPPRPSSGEVRWTVDVTSESESAQIFADARGTIVGANLAGTTQAKALDLFAKPDLVAEAAKAFRFVLGQEVALVRVNVSPQSIDFVTKFSPRNAPLSPEKSGNLVARNVYTWTINGLQRTPSKVIYETDSVAFSVDDIDWSVTSKLVAAAKRELAMAQGRISGVEVSKPMNVVGPLAILWKVEVTNASNERGYVVADTAGAMRQVVPPASQRKTIDWFDPKTMAETFARIPTEFGQDRRYTEITFLGDKVIIVAQDHMQPNSFSQIFLTDTGLQRVGTAAMGAANNVPFRIGDISALTADHIRDLQSKTLATLKMPQKSISSITIGSGSMDRSPSGKVTIEIRAEDKPSGRAGRVIYELDGRVIRAYLP